MDIKIKLLEAADWNEWHPLRLEALQAEPAAFCSSFEEESHWTMQEIQAYLERNDILGVWINDEFIASAGFYRQNSLKTQHKGVLWGLYVKPAYRNQGIASQLISAIITLARAQVTQLHLMVTANNPNAMMLYQKHGFKIYGTEPHALKIEQDFFDQHLMVLTFLDLLY